MVDLEVFGIATDGRAPAGQFGFLPTELVRFGPGAAAQLSAEVDRLGCSRALVVTGKTLAGSDLLERITGPLGKRCVGVFSDTRQHVPRETVVEGTRLARELEADLLVSFGGGSPIDTTKLIALCLAAGVTDTAQMDALHFREEDGGTVVPQMPEAYVPHIALSTTLSAGEFTLWAGATDRDRGVKDAYGAPGMTARTVILDPELTIETPASLWGPTGLKALDHAVETVCSSQPQPFADALALRAIEMLNGALARSTEQPDDLAGRGLCQIAAWMSITALPSVPPGLSHALGHQLGAHCDVPHGVTSCITLPAVMDFNRPANADRQRLVAVAMGLDVEHLDAAAAAAAAAERLRGLVGELGIDVRLSAWNVDDDDLVAIAHDSVDDFMSRTNPRKVESEEQVLELLRALH